MNLERLEKNVGLIIGIIVAVVTLPIAWVALMSGSNWETGTGGSPVSGYMTLGIGWAVAAMFIVTHYHPIHLSW